MAKKLALFDVCETLISFQTADAYVDYVREHIDDPTAAFRMKRWEFFLRFSRAVGIIKFTYKFMPNRQIEKRWKLYQLKGISELYLLKMGQNYVDDVLRYSEIKPVVDRMQQYVLDGYDVLMVSAGYDIYLQFLGGLYGVPVIATELEFVGGTCTGRMAGKDCYGEEKVSRIRKYLFTVDGDAVYEDDCVSYSDSISDLPMMLQCKRAVTVIKKGRKNWGEKYGFECIWVD